jgi:hypothetical protein
MTRSPDSTWIWFYSFTLSQQHHQDFRTLKMSSPVQKAMEMLLLALEKWVGAPDIIFGAAVLRSDGLQAADHCAVPNGKPSWPESAVCMSVRQTESSETGDR